MGYLKREGSFRPSVIRRPSITTFSDIFYETKISSLALTFRQMDFIQMAPVHQKRRLLWQTTRLKRKTKSSSLEPMMKKKKLKFTSSKSGICSNCGHPFKELLRWFCFKIDRRQERLLCFSIMKSFLLRTDDALNLNFANNVISAVIGLRRPSIRSHKIYKTGPVAYGNLHGKILTVRTTFPKEPPGQSEPDFICSL